MNALRATASACLTLILSAGGESALAQSTTESSPRERLREIVQYECLPHWLQAHDPRPCNRVILASGTTPAPGVAVLADRKGGAHFLLIPTLTVVGIESPMLRRPEAPNYFEAAWNARGVLVSVVGHEVPPAMVGLAVNQRAARSQDQLHIHISCLRRSVYEQLRREVGHIGNAWSPIDIDGRRYLALRLGDGELGAANPINLLADGVPGAADELDQFTVLVAGAEFAGGQGLVVLAGTGVPGAELMLDSNCAVAR